MQLARYYTTLCLSWRYSWICYTSLHMVNLNCCNLTLCKCQRVQLWCKDLLLSRLLIASLSSQFLWHSFVVSKWRNLMWTQMKCLDCSSASQLITKPISRRTEIHIVCMEFYLCSRFLLKTFFIWLFQHNVSMQAYMRCVDGVSLPVTCKICTTRQGMTNIFDALFDLIVGLFARL